MSTVITSSNSHTQENQLLHVARMVTATTMDDPILYWNAVALEANQVSHSNDKHEQTGPPLSARALAIVHLAMYDAYAGVFDNQNGLDWYLQKFTQPTIPTGVNPDEVAAAAVAVAAHVTLLALFPSQQAAFDKAYHDLGALSPIGVAFGRKVAEALLAAREDDPGVGGEYYLTGLRGEHRVDPDNPSQGYHAPIYAEEMNSFAVTQRHQLLPPPWNDGTDITYLDALEQVYVRGIAPELMGTLPAGVTKRTTDETVRGIYWGYDGAVGLGTPPRLYNQIVRELAKQQMNTPAENARLFALVNVAMADAGTLAWEQKYIHRFWRPVLGVREHSTAMGPSASQGTHQLDASCDPGWLPLGAPKTNSRDKNFTPPFPAYPSGHATFGAAALHIARLFFRFKHNLQNGLGETAETVAELPADSIFDDTSLLNLEFVSEEFNGRNQDNQGAVRPRHLRKFPNGLWDMIVENGKSRVDLGVHWVFDAFVEKSETDDSPDLTQNIGGVPLGIEIAKDIFKSGMKATTVPPLAATSATLPRAAADAGVDRAIATTSRPRRAGSWRDRIPYLR